MDNPGGSHNRGVRMSSSGPESRVAAQALGIFSPVNEAGSFNFDRILKSGDVLKRTRKTRSWKPAYLVLRPNLLSIYKSSKETQLRHQLKLSDITAVTARKDPKRKVEGAGTFTIHVPSRNFNFEASEQDAADWVESIKKESRLYAEDVLLASQNMPAGRKSSTYTDRASRDGSSVSPEPPENLTGSGRARTQPIVIPKNPSALGPPAPDYGSSVENQDWAGSPNAANWSPISYGRHSIPPTPAAAPKSTLYAAETLQAGRNFSQISVLDLATDEERIVRHGWVHGVKSRGGMRQWKQYWVVLRPKSLALYKSDDEYAANLIVPVQSLLDVVEIDPISKNKQNCFQVISVERNYRFCASNEEDLARWVGSVKSVIAKRAAVRGKQ